ncbi:MAG: hypothetical protein RLZZ587_788 [Actinomycetota bacterium]|jgi:pimeloyl-ACP methyl ester carboxylesterase
MTWALVAGVISFLVVPFLLPNESSGTMTAQQLATIDDRFIDINGLDVRYQHQDFAGDCDCTPPLIILMHGFGASVFSWRDVIEPLGDLGEVIAYDRPAFGLTERPTEWAGTNPYGFAGNFEILDGLIGQFGVDRDVVLVGHSAGGQLAAEYARLHPEFVSALVLVDPAILTTGGTPEGLDWLWAIPQIDRLGPILVGGIATSGDDLLRESFVDQTILTEDVYAGYHLPLKVRGWEEAFWNFAIASKQNALAENLDSLTMPVLLITGDADTVVPTSDTVKLNSLIPGSMLEIVSDSGHLPHEERPTDFMRAIKSHWGYLTR